MDNTRETIKKLHLEFAKNRGSESTYCPSEIARTLQRESWRSQMNLVREVADDLVLDKLIVVMQKGKIITELPSNAKGPIRLRKS